MIPNKHKAKVMDWLLSIHQRKPNNKNSPPTKSLVDISRATLNKAGDELAGAPLVRVLCLRRLPSLLKAAIEH